MNREGLDMNAFYDLATNNYKHGECYLKIKEGYRRLEELYESGTKRDFDMLSETFNLCTPITDRLGVY